MAERSGEAPGRPPIGAVPRRAEFFNDFNEEELDYFQIHGQFSRPGPAMT